ncbi:hypothetical protein LLB_1623 [Legionella longbeachae D-4968]|nr:hypothetical protein LLB_1623 [Legionella longbeachae D-4968]
MNLNRYRCWVYEKIKGEKTEVGNYSGYIDINGCAKLS